MPRYDNHVRARASLAKKVAERRFDEGLNPVARADVRWGSGRFPSIEDLMPAAYEALAAYEWPEGWGTKYSRYRIGGRPMYVDGQTKTVPSRIIRKIMVGMPDLPQFTAGVRRPRPSTVAAVAPESVSTPVTEASPAAEAEYDFDKDVEEARDYLKRVEIASINADDALLATPAGDDTIERLRRESLDAYDRVERAHAELERALRYQRLYRDGADAA